MPYQIKTTSIHTNLDNSDSYRDYTEEQGSFTAHYKTQRGDIDNIYDYTKGSDGYYPIGTGTGSNSQVSATPRYFIICPYSRRNKPLLSTQCYGTNSVGAEGFPCAALGLVAYYDYYTGVTKIWSTYHTYVGGKTQTVNSTDKIYWQVRRVYTRGQPDPLYYDNSNSNWSSTICTNVSVANEASINFPVADIAYKFEITVWTDINNTISIKTFVALNFNYNSQSGYYRASILSDEVNTNTGNDNFGTITWHHPYGSTQWWIQTSTGAGTPIPNYIPLIGVWGDKGS